MTTQVADRGRGWILAGFAVATVLTVASAYAADPPVDRSRVFVLTDISNEPDDEESLVRFLVYANEYDVEGLVATTSTWLRNRTREDLLRRQIDAYGKVRENLAKHADRFPTKEQLLAVTATGQPDVRDGRGRRRQRPRPGRSCCSRPPTKPTIGRCG